MLADSESFDINSSSSHSVFYIMNSGFSQMERMNNDQISSLPLDNDVEYASIVFKCANGTFLYKNIVCSEDIKKKISHHKQIISVIKKLNKIAR